MQSFCHFKPLADTIEMNTQLLFKMISFPFCSEKEDTAMADGPLYTILSFGEKSKC